VASDAFKMIRRSFTACLIRECSQPCSLCLRYQAKAAVNCESRGCAQGSFILVGLLFEILGNAPLTFRATFRPSVILDHDTLSTFDIPRDRRTADRSQITRTSRIEVRQRNWGPLCRQLSLALTTLEPADRVGQPYHTIDIFRITYQY
jgi:hypothetical protein